ncbi:PilN domain-containing protein [Gilliamella sp. wkB178]|uniref:PilN domain-containing protein n=1 Tax=Gilliamella sp. wkB178 TaxID=3120259 RepID=UPI00159EBF85|nr:PilN domain-containing protein [Gilliamella apicola]
MNKSLVIIYIAPTILRYKVIKSVRHLSNTNQPVWNEYSYQNMTDIDLLMSDLLQNIPRYTQFELHLDSSYLQIKSLDLPDEKLKLHEVILYVEASIYKLFQLSVKNVCFDYVDCLEKPKQIMVAICDHQYVNDWLDIFAKYNVAVTFIGSDVGSGKVNFLPWRVQQQKKQRLQLTIIVVSFIGIFCCLFCYWWIQAQNKLDYYSSQVSQQQNLQQKLIQKLSNYLPNPSLSQVQIQQSLELISDQLPDAIWLQSFTYALHTITLTGHSFSYVEITNFNEQLSQHISINRSQVNSVATNANQLLFEMDIKLNEQ